ncbi:hypothetical protein B0H13DRAFT_1852292 [Mycena leptocephala]|nr:hypothetical protein B0H13DRAFT_1852292 [Mycena leptocephala]
MANLPVHPPRTADYQGHTAGGGKKGTERGDAEPREGSTLSPALSATWSLLRTNCPSPPSLSPLHAHPPVITPHHTPSTPCLLSPDVPRAQVKAGSVAPTLTFLPCCPRSIIRVDSGRIQMASEIHGWAGGWAGDIEIGKEEPWGKHGTGPKRRAGMACRGTKIIVWDGIEEPAWGGVEKGRTIVLVISTGEGESLSSKSIRSPTWISRHRCTLHVRRYTSTHVVHCPPGPSRSQQQPAKSSFRVTEG